MRAVMLEVPPHLLEERRRHGVDRWDEMWEGELHMVPPPAERHQSLGTGMIEVLAPLARARGLKVAYDVGLLAADDDYRVPAGVAPWIVLPGAVAVSDDMPTKAAVP